MDGILSDEQYDAILETDFSDEFMELMKRRVVHGYVKQGSVREWLDSKSGVDRKGVTAGHLNDVRRLMTAYGSSGKEWLLADAANYIMFLFMREEQESAT